VSDISANVARDLAHDLVVAEERITAMESQELGFVATLSQMEAEIAALREQVTDLQETKDVLYADNVRLIEQAARMPVWLPIETAPKDGSTFLARDGGEYYGMRWDSDMDGWQVLCGQYVTVEAEPTHWTPIYIDPPAGSGEG
jgi:hypothetical protein